MRLYTRSLLSLTLAATLVSVQGCSKGSEQSPQKAAQESKLLEKIPSSSFGFLVYDESSAAAQRFRKSPWGDQAALEQGLSQWYGSENLSKVALAVYQNVLTTPGSHASSIKEGVWFIGGDLTTKPELGVFVSAATNVAMTERLAALEASLKKEGLTVKKEEIPNLQSFSVELGNSDTPLKVTKVFFVANKDLLAATSELPSATALFDDKVKGGASAMISSPFFTKASQKVRSPGDQFAYGYLDRAFLPQVQKLANITIDQEANKEEQAEEVKTSKGEGKGVKGAEKTVKGEKASPEEAKREVNEFINNLPLGSVFVSSKMGDTPSYQVLGDLTPKDDYQREFLDAFTKAGNQHIGDLVPEATAFLVSIDGKFMTGLRDLGLKHMPNEEKEAFKNQFVLLDLLKSFGVAIRGGAGSPFPELFLIGASDKASELSQSLQQIIGLGLGATGLPLSAWQTKEIEGVKVNYALTPFGIGIYIGASKHAVIIGTSELGVTDALKVSSGKANSMAESIKGAGKELFSERSGPIVFYGNLPQVASMIESLEGSMAMFTGGKSTFDKAQIDRLRSMGTAIATVRATDGMLDIEQSYQSNK